MANDFTKFSAGITENGIDVFNPDFNTALVLSPDSYNLMTGINRGTGPRYGISPIPGQSSLDVTNAGASRGLRSAELTTGDPLDVFYKRRKFLAIVPATLSSIASLINDFTGGPQAFFFWLITDFDGTQNTFTLTPNSSFSSGGAGPNEFIYIRQLRYGFYNPMWDQPADNGSPGGVGTTEYNSPIIRRLGNANPTYPLSASTANFVKEVLKVENSIYYGASAVITVAGRKIPQKWMAGTKRGANGDATHTAIPNMVLIDNGSGITSTGGLSPSWAMKNYLKTNRTLEFFNLYSTSQLAASYRYTDYNVDDTTYVQTFNQNVLTQNIVLNVAGVQTLPDSGAAYNAANVKIVLLNDNEQFCDSAYRIMLFAYKNPYAFVVQDWERDFSGRIVQIVSLTNRFHIPRTISTQNNGNLAGADYKELGYAATTCFENWPTYDGATALPTSVANPVTSGTVYPVVTQPAGSGVLRANTPYEFTFSLFDKQFGIESNVGKPAKFLTGDDDFVALSLKRDQSVAGVFNQYAMVSGAIFTRGYFRKTDGTNTFDNSIVNMMEIRFYYRALGSYEWLPALFIDMAQWLYWPNFRLTLACQGDIAALPGGQPGGYIDYSQLPQDKYDCVLNFKNRAFWFSPTAAIFSLKDNPFAYPIRNATPAPTGGFKGAIVHTYRGQSDQESRLVIFGQRETYIGKFTRVYSQMPVEVSPGVTGNFDVDGSDFTVEAWTSVTAFSYRSAVVADGTLYWWGPQGIYMDDGVGVPKKISKNLEPDIFNLYDSTLADEIHCIYDEKTKDIIWFFPPRADNTISYALTYDVENGQFFLDRFKCKIDWATRLDTNTNTTLTDLNGVRTVIGSRENSSATTQRGFFFDQMNRSGDWSTKRELLCKAVAAGATSVLKVLTFDSGYDATNFATMAVGDFIAIQQFKKYTGQATGDDMICKINAINLVTPSLTIQIPESAVLPTFTASDQLTYFPIWHKAAAGDGLNGIPWVYQSKYWMPGGVNFFAIWRWLYMFFKYTTWLKVGSQTFNLGYRTPTSGDMITDVLTMEDNSDTNWQLYHALRIVNQNNQGQAIKLKLSGSHIGEEWMLQYLEAHTDNELGNLLKRFQG